MAEDKPTVIVTCWMNDEVLAPLCGRAELIRGESSDTVMSRDEVLALAPRADAIINLAELRIDEELLARAGRLRIVANAAAGFNNMDCIAMKAHSVWGTNCPHSFIAATADHAMGLLLTLTKRISEGDAYVRSGQWRKEGWQPGGRWDGTSLAGKQIGIVGYGRIGRAVGVRAQAFGMAVRHWDRHGRGEPDGMALADLLATSDVVSLHCPLTPETTHLMNASTFSQLKPGAILLNLARGPVVHMEALLNALERGQVSAAGLDVFEFEPEVPYALFSRSNVVLTPHMGGCTREGRRAAWQVCADNVARVLSGAPPETPVFSL